MSDFRRIELLSRNPARERSEFFDDVPKEVASLPAYRNMSPIHRAILVCFIQGMGMTKTARHLGIGIATVSKIYNHDEDFIEVFETFDKARMEKAINNASRVREALDKDSVDAEEILAALMRDDEVPAAVRKSAADSILEKAGHKAPDRLQLGVDQQMEITISDFDYDPEKDPYLTLDPNRGNIIQDSKKKIDEEIERFNKDHPSFDSNNLKIEK